MIKKFKIILLFFLILPTIYSFGQIVKEKPNPPENTGGVPTLPQTGMVWIDGFWRWDIDKNEYVWCMGHYVKPLKDHAWQQGKWKKVRKGYKWIPGKWKKIRDQVKPAKTN